ncbi:MAG: PEP-CTERM sorting domain-containing protein [Opitutaceae bacterium]
MKKIFFLTSFAALAACATTNAAIVNLDALDIRATGIFGHADASAFAVDDSTAGTVVYTFTYSNLDLDGDATANDTANFTFTATGTNVRAFNQGTDQGFGVLTGLTFTGAVSGTTTDSGHNVVFDGFTGAIAAAGGNGDINRTGDINGQSYSLVSANTGSFQFLQTGFDFALTPSVLFDNAGGDFGSHVARNFDVQISTVVPEPSSYALLAGALALGAVMIRRRRA